ncbi:hypothetical protein [Campylobacter sp.]|uniref:hypothetical protein n=1 Tax=Campylobacter sp. TaxID=205 RepID=UPI0026F9638A|nr:hypothetical protein [Campylobacter sp.]
MASKFELANKQLTPKFASRFVKFVVWIHKISKMEGWNLSFYGDDFFKFALVKVASCKFRQRR